MTPTTSADADSPLDPAAAADADSPLDPATTGDPASGSPAPADATLGGYIETHDRPPAFSAVDGHPYTVSLEVERTGDLRAPCHGFLVFPRWAETGVGIIGHVESETLVRAATTGEAERGLGGLTLVQVQAILDEAVARAGHTTSPNDQAPHAP